MFVIPSYKFQVSNWREKKSLLYKLYDNVQFTNDDPESNVHTDYGQDKHVESVCNILNDDLQRFCNHYMLQNVQVYNAWFQKYNDGQFHAPHNHGPVGWSCVLYIEFDPYHSQKFVESVSMLLRCELRKKGKSKLNIIRFCNVSNSFFDKKLSITFIVIYYPILYFKTFYHHIKCD